MKKSTSRIKEEIVRLQNQLKQAEMREAERIGCIALKAGLGELAIEEGRLLVAFESIVAQFRESGPKSSGRQRASLPTPVGAKATTVTPDATASGNYQA